MNIPKELLEYDNWIVWRSQERGGKLTKIPYTLKGKLADTTDRTTWGSYDEAIKALEKGNYEGLGFVFTDSPFAGVDLDHVLNGDELDTEAAEIVAVLNSYTERSPGGDGLHVLVKGTLPEGRRRKGNVEMYDTGRYFTMTGEHWAGTPKAVEDRQSQLRMVHKALFSDNGKTAREPRPAPLSPASLDDRDLLEKAMNAKNGTKFASLWNGDTSGYKSHSEADLALASMLAFWFGNDAARIERLFSQSGLGQRDKWRERADYRTRTIAKAVESGECYDPNSHNVPQSVSEALEHREDGKSGDSKPQKDTEGADPGKLLEKAAAIDDPIERAKAMKAFLRSLVGFSETMQDAWLERAKEKTGFGKTVLTHDLKRVQQEDEGKEPGQRELHERWLKSYPHTVRTVYWRRYEGGWWPVIPEDEVKREIKTIVQEAEAEGVELTSYLVNQVMDLVSTERFLHPEQWDVNLNLLVCKNGTLDLKTLELQEHAPENYATAAVEYEYDPEADCPTFRRVVSTTMSHAADFLQEFAGYCLTTDTSLETAVWLKGDPGGGKSTFLEGLQVMLGERCGTLGIANIERSRFGLAGIIGKTLLIASDQPGGYITASNILNNLISGERVPVERKHKDVVDVTPRAKICWSMNSLPNVKGGGNSGLFRRVEVVECETVPEAKRDPAVKEQVKKEAAGILNWAIEGLQRLRERGRFDPPTSVTKATKKFQERNDKPALFLKARLIRGPERKVKASELYKAYKVWCDENGYKSEARQKLSDDWKRLGLERKKRRSGYYYFGAGLLDQHKS